MNYASVITIGVVVLSLLSVHNIAQSDPMIDIQSVTRVWYILGGRKHYKGPVSNLPKARATNHNETESGSKESDFKEKVAV